MVGEWFLENNNDEIDGWIPDFLLIFPTDWYLLLGQKLMAQIHLSNTETTTTMKGTMNDPNDAPRNNNNYRRSVNVRLVLETPIATTLSTSRVCKGRPPHGFQYHQLVKC